MSTVFVSVSMTLDGYIAPETRADDPTGERWMAEWMRMQRWVADQQFFRENLALGDGGDTGDDNERLKRTFDRTGASIMGKRMFEAGEHRWPEEAPFHTPVYVVTHEVREAWERPGGTIFYFVNDGIESALDRAREAAGERDVRIAGGANVIGQYLAAGLVGELEIGLAPVIFGSGIPLFGGVDTGRLRLVPAEAVASTKVTHLRYQATSA